jgi:uncharacterized membrane protein YkvA (DUF1232 family)
MRKWVLLILAVLYTLNPYDIVPDFMIGSGWLDDLIIWIVLWRYLVSLNKKNANYSRYYKQSDARFESSNRNKQQDRQRRGASDQNPRSTTPWDPYRTLGIDRNASDAEIKHAYRELANKYHPDKLEHLGDEFKTLAENRFKEIQQAYQELIGK